MTDAEQLQAMKSAYYSGLSEVRMGDRMTKYRTLDELGRAIRAKEREMGVRQPNRVYTSFSRGLAK